MKKSHWFFLKIFLAGTMMLAIIGCAPSSLKKQENIFQLPAIIKYPSETETKKQALISERDLISERKKKRLIAQEKEELAKQPKITNFWEGTDLRTVLQDIATQAKVSIVADETIPPTAITLEAKELPLEETLKMVLLTGGYFKRIKDNSGEYYLVGSGMPDSLMSLSISESKKIITNRPAKEISSLLSPSLALFVMKSGENDYSIIATAPPYILDKISQQIDLIDKPPFQIVIEIMICESKWDKEKSIGIDWSKVLQIQGVAKMAWQKGQQGQGNEWTYAGKFGADLESAIQALATDGKVSVKAKPKIVVAEGEEATIDVSTDFYVNLYGQDSQTIALSESAAPYYSSTRYRAEPIKVGVTLRVKPRISREGEVLLNLSSDVSNLITVKNDGFPVVSRRSVKTTVRVESGETVTVGGLYQENFQESLAGLPGLRKTYLFGTKKSLKEGTELIIFLTPKILGKV